MASRIETACAALQDYFGEGITFAFGGKARYSNSKFPRIVWVPTDGSPAATRPRAGGNPRPLVQFGQAIEARIWGADTEQVEGLMGDLTRALVRQFKAPGAGWQYLGHRWTSEESVTKGGCSAVYQFALPMVFEDAEFPTVEILTTEEDPAGATDNGILESGDT